MELRPIIVRRPRKREPVVWVVDSEQWPRACLRAELIERGYDAYGFITGADALEYVARGASPKPEALILELRGQNVTNELVEAIRNLQVTTILLGGSTELCDPLIQNRKWDVVLKRPVSLGDIAGVVERLVPKTQTA
jgi:hypothetical protein